MTKIKNIFACLVHEEEACIVDLVRNLNYLDPNSVIILYNGGPNKNLLTGFPFERYGVYIHPTPRRLKWGWLHDFALDCMRYAFEQQIQFDTLTIVDSDQLGVGLNYSDFIAPIVLNNPKLGMLCTTAERQESHTTIPPAVTAYREKKLWTKYLAKLPEGETAFLYWTFWPASVFTYKACRDLVHLFDSDEELKRILRITKIWASEEIILPTLVKAMGYDIVKNPCNDKYTQFRKNYNQEDIDNALQQHDTFWVHPVLRKPNAIFRKHIAKYFNYYVQVPEMYVKEEIDYKEKIWEKVEKIDGWLDKEEAFALIEATEELLNKHQQPQVVEIGAYGGKMTATIGLTATYLKKHLRLYSIDNFKEKIGAADTGLVNRAVSIQEFNFQLKSLGLQDSVNVFKGRAWEIGWNQQINLLLIDGLHDYTNVAKDFFAFEKWLIKGAKVIFHDYADYFPGVVAFVQELINSKEYQTISLTNSLIVLEKMTLQPDFEFQQPELSKKKVEIPTETMPMVSCIMPTYNRSAYIKNGIQCFLNQTYLKKELIIVDDGEEEIKHLIPDHKNIKYYKLEERLTIGAKRNKACEWSKGDIIIHFDDDDWYDSNWIKSQVTTLLREKANITGLNRPYFYDEQQQTGWQYIYPAHQRTWVYGATLCYRKYFWENNPFPEINIGEDNQFVWKKASENIAINQNTKLFVARVHNQNTSKKQLSGSRWKSVTLKTVKDIIQKI